MRQSGPGIVLQALQRVIDPHGIKQRQRKGVARAVLPQAIRHLVTHMGQFRGGKMQGQFGRRHIVAAQVVALFEDVRVGDFLLRPLDGDRRAIILHQKAQLLHQVAPEVIGVGDGGGVGAGPLELRIGPRNTGLDAGRAVFHAKFRVAEALPLLLRWRQAGVEIAFHAGLQAAGGCRGGGRSADRRRLQVSGHGSMRQSL